MRIYIALAVLLILSLGGCSTKKNTLLTRSYHNLTAHYNVYFNGNESFKKGIKKLNNGLQDDYLELLSIFPPVGKVGESPVSADMDKAIKKGTKLITFHSITVKPNYKKGLKTERQKAFYNKKEYNNWVDDAYLLIGKSHFNNYNMNMAEETFRHIIQDFPEEKTHYEASVWLARTLIEQNELTQARLLLEEIAVSTSFPKKQKSFLNATYADCYMRLKNLPLAIEFLEKAMAFERTKAVRARYSYILAQLYQRTGNYVKSSSYFDKVISANPNYTMTFNATISRASVSGASDAQAVREQLKKLLRDSKNKEYNDQIYFALGNLDIQAGKKKEAIDNYRMSAKVCVQNIRQKVRSFIAIADIYYADREYIPASINYDSAMLVIDEKFPNYLEISNRSKNLSALVTQLNKANFEDSTQRVALMNTSERNTFIDNLIKDVVAKEETARAEELANQERLANMGSDSYENRQFSQQISSGKWYFYNQASKSFGQVEFAKKWGRRTLEDNWRRKNKAANTTNLSNSTSSDSTDVVGDNKTGKKDNAKLSNKTREYYLRNLPLTDSARKVSDSKLQEALFNAGKVYRNNLKEPYKAIEVLEMLNKRYASYLLKLEVLNQLYELNRETNNTPMMEMYKKIILTDFPSSVYASILGDPNYVQRLRDKEKSITNYYTETYNAFNANNMSEVITRTSTILNSSDNNPYKSRYALLNAMALGKLNGIEAYRKALTELKETYKGTSEAKKAQEIIASIDEKKPDLKQAEIQKKADVTYSATLNETHIFAWFIPTGEGIANQLNFNLINYNLDTYSTTTLNVTILDLTSVGKIVVVGNFNSGAEALNYYDNAEKNQNLLNDTQITAPIRFVITPANLLKLQADGDLGAYIAFFRKTYKR